MDINKSDLSFVEASVVDCNQSTAVLDLHDLQLALVGGGIGETTL